MRARTDRRWKWTRVASSQSALIVRLVDVSRKDTTSRSSDYATGRTSFGADRQTVRSIGVDHSSVHPSADRFSSRPIHDQSPEVSLINVIHQYCPILVLSAREKSHSPSPVINIANFIVHSVTKVKGIVRKKRTCSYSTMCDIILDWNLKNN